MAKVIFIGNYKGGVGKTTSVLNFAEYFSKHLNSMNGEERSGKGVLVLDIDPQSSLSEILVRKQCNMELKDVGERHTLNYVFDLNILKIRKYNNINLSFDSDMIVRGRGAFDFIPSSLFYRGNMGLDAIALRMEDDIRYLSILKNYCDTISSEYEYILIDCPPTNNLITRSAFLMSDYYIIPTVLDGLSTNGVVHYINTVEATYNDYCGKDKGDEGLIARHFFGDGPKLLGIFYNMIRRQVNYVEENNRFRDALDKDKVVKRLGGQALILDSRVDNYIGIARSTQEGNVSISDKDFERLANEILSVI